MQVACKNDDCALNGICSISISNILYKVVYKQNTFVQPNKTQDHINY
jgi:hypothetical protein